MTELSRRPAVTLEQLRTFVAVARAEHITRAAAALHLSQGAVSEQVRLVERGLRLQLLERIGRGVRVTDDGRDIERAASLVLAAVGDLEEVAVHRRGIAAGSLVIAASSTAGVHRLPHWLAGFVSDHPTVRVRVELANTAAVVAALRAGDVDCAVVEGPIPTVGLDILDVERDELVLVAAAEHPLASLRHVGSAVLARHRYLRREAGSATEGLAARVVGTAYGRSPTLELSQAAAIRSAVLDGLGYAVISRTMVADDIARGRIAVLPRPGIARQFRALRRSTSRSPVLTAFWEHLAVLAPQPAPHTGSDELVRGARRAPPRRRGSRPASAATRAGPGQPRPRR
ncbi:MAG: LysR family transcriptional regulator [Candidatus Dormibacteria bacterium]